MTRTILTAALALAATLAAAAPADASNRSFHTPMINGQEIDVRYTRHERPRPSFVATKFCRAQGFDRAEHWQTRRFQSTRALGDHRVLKRNRGHNPVGFTQIVCATQSQVHRPAPQSTFQRFQHVTLESRDFGHFTEFDFDKDRIANAFCLAKGFHRASDYYFLGLGQNRPAGAFTTAVYNPMARYRDITCEQLPFVTR